MKNSPRRLLPALALAVAGSFLTQCASFKPLPASSSSKLFVLPSESMLLVAQPFDSVVKAELVRSGLDPAVIEKAFNAELHYRFSQRKQEEALDSAAAEVILTVQVKHLQPGSGNAGTFGALRAQTLRKRGTVQRSEWEWRKSAKYNVEPPYLERHIVGLAADEIMSRVLASRPRPNDPPPPLQLLH